MRCVRARTYKEPRLQPLQEVKRLKQIQYRMSRNVPVNFNLITSHIMVLAVLGSGLGAGLFYLVLTAASIATYFFFCSSRLYPGLPTAGLGASGFFGSLKEARKRWLEDGSSVIEEGLKQVHILTRETLPLN